MSKHNNSSTRQIRQSQRRQPRPCRKQLPLWSVVGGVLICGGGGSYAEALHTMRSTRQFPSHVVVAVSSSVSSSVAKYKRIGPASYTIVDADGSMQHHLFGLPDILLIGWQGGTLKWIGSNQLLPVGSNTKVMAAQDSSGVFACYASDPLDCESMFADIIIKD